VGNGKYLLHHLPFSVRIKDAGRHLLEQIVNCVDRCIEKLNIRKVKFLIIGVTKKVIIENGGGKNIQEEY